jgi:two-component system, OmpR family, aerobic respiration control sensor histidine kinase ArcB
MTLYKDIAAVVFMAALLFNAILFIPQARKIWKEQTARGVSLLTFLGFLFIQLSVVIHGFIRHDYVLIIGYLLSMVTCGAVVALVIYFRKKQSAHIEGENLTLADVIDQLPGHIYWKNKDGVFLGSNQLNWKDFGLKSQEDYLGKTDYDLFPKAQADAITYTDNEVMRTGKLHIVEETAKGGDGTLGLFLSHKAPLRNKKGEIIGSAGLSLNVTEAKQKEDDRLDLLENVIALMPGHVYWLGKDGRYQGCNDQQARSAGLTNRKEIIGKRNSDLPWNCNAGVLPEMLDQANKDVMTCGQTKVIEEPATLQNGAQAIFLSSKVPMRNKSNQVIGMLGISIDITEQKKQQQEVEKAKQHAERSNQIKSDFISNMEHDIRTPFVGVYGMIDLLAKKETDPEKKSILSDVSVCAKELMDYCDKILEFSRIEAEAQPVLFQLFPLRKIIDSVITIEGIAAKNKGVDLSLHYDEQLPLILMGDTYRLKRILLNLVSNAIKFTPKGFVKISVALEKQNTEKRTIIVKFTVQDSGIGIPNDKKALIYERFTKAMLSNKGLYKGLGLGLRIVKQFVNELDGDIHLKSTLNKGSTFVVLLPFKAPLSDNIFDEEQKT